MDLKDLPANIVELPLFGELSRDDIAGVLKRCSKLFLSAGQHLMKAGELADCCYLILKGKVEIRLKQHREVKTLATLEAGHLVGEMGLFRDKPYRIADAVIVRDSQLVQLPYHYLKRLEGVAPDVAARLTRNLSEIATTRVRSLAASIAPAAASPPADDPAAPAQTQGAGAAPEAVTLVPIQIKMALARCPMFEGFDQDDLQRLGDRVQATRYPAGQPVFLAGDRADSMYVVALGRLLVVAEVDGDIQEVASLTAGNCFGELALINAEPVRSASILADTLATILRIGYDDLRDATAWRPRTRERFEANLARLAVERS